MLSGKIVQVAYFVDDVRKAAVSMNRTFGAGPFFVADRIELAWGEHRGKPCSFVHSSAYGQWGRVMMELVQQDSEGPSPFRDMYAPGESGIHHVATLVDSLEESLDRYASHGFGIAARAATRSGVEFAFIDAVAQLGHMVEVYEATAQLTDFYAFVERAALNWNGADPVRTLGSG